MQTTTSIGTRKAEGRTDIKAKNHLAQGLDISKASEEETCSPGAPSQPRRSGIPGPLHNNLS